MNAAIDLTIALRPRDAGYIADAHLDNPESAALAPLAINVPLVLDHQALLALTNDLSTYGQALTLQIFPVGGPLRDAWQRARDLADGANRPLRLRLKLAADAHELHAIIWERLRDPRTDQPLALDARLRLVRTLDSAETRPLTLGPKPDLRALLAVANPRDLSSSYRLTELDPDGEASRARQALGAIPLTVVGDASAAVAPRATLTAIQAALRAGPMILALLAHAQATATGTVLFLENAAGDVERVTGTAFVTMLSQLERPPLLVVLLACDSGGAIAALGPQLAQAGVGAVVAMQAKLSIPAARRFLPALFGDLARDGQLDRAVSVARAELRDGDEWATPALWLRTRDGRLWEKQPAAPAGIPIGGNASTVQQINVSGGTVGNQVNDGATPQTIGGNASTIATQRQRLDTHRATLAHYLNQLAITGSAHAPPAITHGINEARAGIAKAKAALAALGMPVADHPDDTP